MFFVETFKKLYTVLLFICLSREWNSSTVLQLVRCSRKKKWPPACSLCFCSAGRSPWGFPSSFAGSWAASPLFTYGCTFNQSFHFEWIL